MPIRTLYRSLVPAIILLVAAACADDPTPTRSQTPTATPGPTATPTVSYFTTELVTPVPTRPRPTATPTPTPAPAAGVVYVLDRISTPDCNYELRMGQTSAWGYNDPVADARINATEGDGILITVNVGDKLEFRRFENPTRICLETVSIVNEELGLSETLAPDERVVPFSMAFTKAGTFVIDDPAKPGGRGTFVIVVNEAAGSAAGVVYVLARISTPACRYELRMGETTAWGYGGPEDGDQRIQAGADPQDGRDYKHIGGIEIGPLNVGDTLQFGRFENPSRICLETVSLVNEELGLSATLAPDERIEPFEIVLTKAGRFVLDDPAKPGERGSFVIVVEE